MRFLSPVVRSCGFSAFTSLANHFRYARPGTRTDTPGSVLLSSTAIHHDSTAKTPGCPYHTHQPNDGRKRFRTIANPEAHQAGQVTRADPHRASSATRTHPRLRSMSCMAATTTPWTFVPRAEPPGKNPLRAQRKRLEKAKEQYDEKLLRHDQPCKKNRVIGRNSR
jgi:hypothetical protein